MSQMNYKTHPGVVMTTICDTPVLIPLRTFYPQLRKLVRLPFMMVPLWDYLSNGKSVDYYAQMISKITKRSEEEVRQRAEKLCEEFCKLGYLIAVPDGEPVEDPQSQEEPGAISQNHLPQDE